MAPGARRGSPEYSQGHGFIAAMETKASQPTFGSDLYTSGRTPRASDGPLAAVSRRSLRISAESRPFRLSRRVPGSRQSASLVAVDFAPKGKCCENIRRVDDGRRTRHYSYHYCDPSLGGGALPCPAHPRQSSRRTCPHGSRHLSAVSGRWQRLSTYCAGTMFASSP